MPGIFAQIIVGQIPSYKIAENEFCYAFLDVFPLVPGHTLVVPKIEIDNIHDLDAETHAALFAFSKQIAHAIGKAIPCKKVGMAVVGLEVPHAHIHLVPLNQVADLDFSKPKVRASDESLQRVQERIQAALF
ncbi:MAG: HIT family protein [Bacteroidia bacterium]|jgi:histidine triad (HIT) family protein